MAFIEVDVNENIRLKLESQLSSKQKRIEELEEALQIPRDHYKFVEKMSTEEILKQKDAIIQKLSVQLGVRPENLVAMMYEQEASKTAKRDFESQDLGRQQSLKLMEGSKRMQRDLSVGTLASKNTLSTLNGFIMAPQFGLRRMHSVVKQSPTASKDLLHQSEF
jgi:hypothetical protein